MSIERRGRRLSTTYEVMTEFYGDAGNYEIIATRTVPTPSQDQTNDEKVPCVNRTDSPRSASRTDSPRSASRTDSPRSAKSPIQETEVPIQSSPVHSNSPYRTNRTRRPSFLAEVAAELHPVSNQRSGKAVGELPAVCIDSTRDSQPSSCNSSSGALSRQKIPHPSFVSACKKEPTPRSTETLATDDEITHLRDGQTSVVVFCKGGMPAILHFGEYLGEDELDARMFRGSNGDGSQAVELIEKPCGKLSQRAGIEGVRPKGATVPHIFKAVSITSSPRRFTCELVDVVGTNTHNVRTTIHLMPPTARCAVIRLAPSRSSWIFRSN